MESKERGITVSSRPQQGARLSAFRGEGRLSGNVLQLLAVILDAREIERWAYGITRSRSIESNHPAGDLIHLYADTPWPVRDRDMVVRRSFEVVASGREYVVSVRCQPDAAPHQDNVIRVRDCESRFVLRRIDENHTHVVYESSLEPEGRVPSWASEWIAKNAPLKTLIALEARAARTLGRYASVVKRWSSIL